MKKLLYILSFIFLLSCNEDIEVKDSEYIKNNKFEVGDVVSIKGFKSKCNCVVNNAWRESSRVMCEDSLGRINSLENYIDNNILIKCEQ